MADLIKNLSIRNFKSIKELDLKSKRINLFIGKPNAGKSNILEALSMYCGCFETNAQRKFLNSFIRFDTLNDLFHYRDVDNAVEVVTDLGFATLMHYRGIDSFVYAVGDNIEPFHNHKLLNESIGDFIQGFESELKNDKSYIYSTIQYLNADSFNGNPFNKIPDKTPFKKYHFKSIEKTDNRFSLFLTYDGSNLYTMLDMYRELADYAAEFFEEYGLEYVMVQSDKKMLIQRKLGRIVNQLGFELTPDTFQRLIYHVAAIKSNTNSVLLFEEPESHSFPPYIAEFANQVIDSKDNQFFITTHSPYLLDSFLQDMSIAEELNIVLTWFENYETKIRVLSEEEIKQIFGNGIDIFFSIDNYITKSK